MKITDKVFLVTGAGGGIGGAITIELIQKGGRVAAIDMQDDALQALMKIPEASEHALRLYDVDITDKRAVDSLPSQIIADFGALDGVINCAGVIQPFAKIDEIAQDAIERVMQVNFYGQLYLLQATLPILRQRDEASIVNISSMGGFLPVPGQGIYGASKAAVSLLSQSLYSELIGTNIHVTTVYPGATNTQITRNSGVEAPSDPSELSIPMNSKERVAKKVVRAIERQKASLYTGMDSWGMNKLYRLSPTLATRLIARLMRSLLK